MLWLSKRHTKWGRFQPRDTIIPLSISPYQIIQHFLNSLKWCQKLFTGKNNSFIYSVIHGRGIEGERGSQIVMTERGGGSPYRSKIVWHNNEQPLKLLHLKFSLARLHLLDLTWTSSLGANSLTVSLFIPLIQVIQLHYFNCFTSLELLPFDYFTWTT